MTVTCFLAYRIGRLPADEIENFLMDEVAAGIAPSSVHRHYRAFRGMLEVADEKDKIVVKPCSRMRPPRSPFGRWCSRVIEATPWGPVAVGGSPPLRFEPSSACWSGT
ncbi:MAG: hypothetical protein M0004_10335 [Actinomycetota bacterium]|nr:hypothetical protein [Actinomycetota bacterium]